MDQNGFAVTYCFVIALVLAIPLGILCRKQVAGLLFKLGRTFLALGEKCMNWGWTIHGPKRGK